MFECNLPGNKTNMNKIWDPFFESCSNFTSPKMGQFYHSPLTSVLMQHAKKVVSNSPGPMNVAIELVHSVFTLPNGQMMFFEEFK